MTWSRFDDGYDEHEKIEAAWFAFPANPVGLHVMATTACNRWGSDGVIRPRWLLQKLPQPRRRADVLAEMVTLELFDKLPAGEATVVADDDGNQIPVGPFDEDRYIVHDFLDRHESSLQVKERRRKDADRKRPPASNGNPGGIRSDSTRNPVGIPVESGASRGRPREGASARPDPTRPDQGPPSPPKGGRKRAGDSYEKEVAAYALGLFPDADPLEAAGHVRAAIAALRPAERTTENVRARAARWLEPPAAPASAAELGAAVVAFNSNAQGAAA